MKKWIEWYAKCFLAMRRTGVAGLIHSLSPKPESVSRNKSIIRIFVGVVVVIYCIEMCLVSDGGEINYFKEYRTILF